MINTITGNNLVEKAARVAAHAHWTQKRKGDQLPYIIHPVMLAVKFATGVEV